MVTSEDPMRLAQPGAGNGVREQPGTKAALSVQ